MELLNHADFLNVMPSNEALARWFINDTMNFGTYRIKGHAAKDFWEWVSSWAVCVNKPSDIGYDDDGFILPELKTIEHIVQYDVPYDLENGLLFKETRMINATKLFRELRETAPQRVKKAAELVNDSDEGWVVWCNTNDEAKALNKAINGSVNVHGALPIEIKESLIKSFSEGEIRVMISKPSMCGFGLNWQHVHNMAFVGLSYSFEQRYQAARRLWRFGQKNIVYEHLILSPAEKQQILSVVRRKEMKHIEMGKQMVNSINKAGQLNDKKLITTYDREVFAGKNYELILGDSCEEIKNIESDSIHFSIFSPPFSNLYIYSDMIQDMGNSSGDDEFFKHFNFLIPELHRVLMPGRLCAVHCKDLVNYKSRDGASGLRDMPGAIIRLFESNGFQYHSKITIWKDPVIEMQRTKAQGLLHKQIKKDSSMSRQGLPDYLIIFRKWPDTGETSGPVPVEHEKGFRGYVGEDGPDSGKYLHSRGTEEYSNLIKLDQVEDGDDIFSIHVWQRYASPVWFDIQQTNVLNCRIARDDQDEKHICPLQLDVIERSIHLWTNPGETVFTPFAGIGSEVYGAVKLGRRGVGIELKKTYIEQAHKFLQTLENKPRQMELFG
jgi:DNA modification methylase